MFQREADLGLQRTQPRIGVLPVGATSPTSSSTVSTTSPDASTNSSAPAPNSSRYASGSQRSTPSTATTTPSALPSPRDPAGAATAARRGIIPLSSPLGRSTRGAPDPRGRSRQGLDSVGIACVPAGVSVIVGAQQHVGAGVDASQNVSRSVHVPHCSPRSRGGVVRRPWWRRTPTSPGRSSPPVSTTWSGPSLTCPPHPVCPGDAEHPASPGPADHGAADEAGLRPTRSCCVRGPSPASKRSGACRQRCPPRSR